MGFRRRVYVIIFEAETTAGRAFDVALLWSIVISVLAVMLESVDSINITFGPYLKVLEVTLTILFTIEYILRIISIKRPMGYIFSFYGLIDLLAIIPTYLSLFIAGSQYLLIIRALRLLRIFRILKLGRYIGEAHVLREALIASREKIVVFVGTVLTLSLIIGAVMYLVEGPPEFSSIPRSVYWAIVTLTTVGYGDIAPHSALGQFLAAIVMIMGYGIIAVPTGIVTVEIANAVQSESKKPSLKNSTHACHECSAGGHDDDAAFCKYCGAKLIQITDRNLWDYTD